VTLSGAGGTQGRDAAGPGRRPAALAARPGRV